MQPISSVNFKAKLKPATSGGRKNEKLLKFFEMKTRDFPELTLVQEKLNFNGKDTFKLLSPRGEVAIGEAKHSCYSYVCTEEMADRFVEVFKELIQKIR